MKQLITLHLFLVTVFSVQAQSEAEKRMNKELESIPYRESADIPQSFVVVSNDGNTFIKDSVNYVQAVAHGYHDTKLEGVNCTVKRIKNTNTYEVFTPKAGECQITIYGVNTTTKKSVPLGTYMYTVAEKIEHTFVINGKRSGEVITAPFASIACKNLHYWNYEENIELLEWSMESGGKTISGKGENTDKSVETWLKAIPAGQTIVVKGKAKSNFQGTFEVTSVFLKGN